MEKNELISFDNVQGTKSIVDVITEKLSFDRNVLPNEDSLNYALEQLPRHLNKLPIRLKDEMIVKACIATSVGLYDGAIVYVWNSMINELKRKVDAFGMEMISKFLSKKKDGFLNDIKDAELLKLCNQLNIVSKEGYFYLDQCREIRNSASIAHPTELNIDEIELISFIARCCKYGLADERIHEGIDIKEFKSVISNENTDEVTLNTIVSKIEKTFDLQRELVFRIIYSTYTSKESSGIERKNSLILANRTKHLMETNTITTFIEEHNKKLVQGKNTKLSEQFLEKIDALKYLENSAQVAILKNAIERLESAHLSFDNFYIEPAFSERLKELSLKITPIPEIIISEYVTVNLVCYLGNGYGVSEKAHSDYSYMLKNLSPKAIEFLLKFLEREEKYVIEEKSQPWKREHLSSLLDFYETSGMLIESQENSMKYIREKYKI